MVDTTVFVLHYSDDKTNPAAYSKVNGEWKRHTVSNLALNELLLRCVQSIERNTSYPHKLVVVDNGSPEVGHEDAVNLLKEHGLTPEFLWVREDWHPVAVGANRAMDALETDYMAFITSDTKPGKNWLQHMIEPLKLDQWHMTACEPNLTMYGVGEPNQYRTPALWEWLNYKSPALGIRDYFIKHRVGYEMDEYNEPVPICRPHINCGHGRIGIFTTSRDFIDKAGRYDEKILRSCEYQYYDQAIKRGIKSPTSQAFGSYLCHYGGFWRAGVGSYASKKYPGITYRRKKKGEP